LRAARGHGSLGRMKTSWRKLGAWLAWPLGALAVTSGASAQANGVQPGPRLGLTMEVLAPSELTFATRRPGGGSSTVSTRTTSYGLGVPRMGLDIGALVTPELSIGVRGGLSGREATASVGGTAASTNELQYRLLAYGEARIVAHPVVAIGLRGELGVAGSEGSGEGAGAARTTTTLFQIGGQLAAHLHPVAAVSISPYVGASYLAGGGSDTTLPVDSVSGWELSVGVTLYAWLSLTAPSEPDESGVDEPDVRPAPPGDEPPAAVPEAEPAPSSRPAPEALRAEDGWQSRQLALGGWGDATAWLHPVLGAARVAIPITLPRDTALTFCSSAQLGAETASVIGAGPDDGVVIATSRSGLESLLSAGRLELCGASFVLTDAGRGTLAALLGVAAPEP
jgi:hypothetical protein